MRGWASITMLAHGTGLVAVFRTAIEVLFGAIALGIGLLVAVGLGGPIATWTRTYGLMFYGGRYAALGTC